MAAPSLLVGKAVRRPADLERFPTIDFLYTSTGKVSPWNFERRGVRQELPPRGRVAIGSADAIIQAAVAGLGVVQTLDLLAAPELKAGRLVQLLRPLGRAGAADLGPLPEQSLRFGSRPYFRRLCSDGVSEQ